MLDPDVADYQADRPVEGVCGARTAPVGATLPPGDALSNWLSAAGLRHVQAPRAVTEVQEKDTLEVGG